MKQAWTREEDMIILGGVSTFGNKWSKIVAQLPVHRTDDAVRNRWQRLLRKQERADQEAEPSPPPLTGVKRAASFDVGAAASADDTAAFAAMMQQHGAGGTPKASGDLPLQPTRALSLPTPEVAVDQKGGDMWTAEEDRTIDEGVRLEGLRWREIAARLPGRTESRLPQPLGAHAGAPLRCQRRAGPRRRRGVRRAPRRRPHHQAPQVGAPAVDVLDLAPARRRHRAVTETERFSPSVRRTGLKWSPRVLCPSLLGCG